MESGGAPRQVAHALSGYLCGTHSGGHVLRGSRRVSVTQAARAHRSLDEGRGAPWTTIGLGDNGWCPTGVRERVLRQSLARSLACDDVVDLVLFGSLARGTTTSYSDVDAVLVLSDEAADDVARLRALRSRVFTAQRHVLEYQSMQHHGFLVATPRLLTKASAALGLPAEALGETASLFGNPIQASFARDQRVDATAFRALVKPLLETRSWPRHTWYLHRLVAMFALVPALYLRATGRPSAKHLSFGLARAEFDDLWSPYDVLADVRARWPRQSHGVLQFGARALRNPWTAVALWRRVPVSVPPPLTSLLDEPCLRRLQTVVRAMAEKVR